MTSYHGIPYTYLLLPGDDGCPGGQGLQRGHPHLVGRGLGGRQILGAVCGGGAGGQRGLTGRGPGLGWTPLGRWSVGFGGHWQMCVHVLPPSALHQETKKWWFIVWRSPRAFYRSLMRFPVHRISLSITIYDAESVHFTLVFSFCIRHKCPMIVSRPRTVSRLDLLILEDGRWLNHPVHPPWWQHLLHLPPPLSLSLHFLEAPDGGQKSSVLKW